jgi:fibronectin-binding autotransporter adhesin
MTSRAIRRCAGSTQSQNKAKSPGKPPRVLTAISAAALATVVGMSHEASGTTVTMTGNDASGVSSFNSAVNWSPAPSAGNTYVDNQFTLRTPQDGMTAYTFQGDSLTLGSTSSTVFGLLKFKNQMTGTTITIGNLILAGGVINQAANNNINTILAGNISLSGGTTSILDTSGGDATRQITVNAPITGTGSLNINGTWSHTSDGATGANGAGTIFLGASNSFSGSTTVSSGVLQLNNANALLNSTAILNGAANCLTFNTGIGSFTLGGLSGTAGFTLQDTTNTAITLTVGNNNASTTYSGAMGGSGSLIDAGTGTLTLTGNNAYNGTTTINPGATVSMGSGGNSGSVGLGAVTDNGTLIANRNDGALTLSTQISGSGAFTQAGVGTTTLAASNSYMGSTSVTGGTLVIAAAGNVSSSSALVMGGGSVGAATLNIASGRSGSSIAFNNTTFNAGTSNFSLPTSLGSGDSLALGTLTRNAGAFVNFGTLPTTGTVTTTSSNTGGILGPYFIPNGNPDGNWAMSSGGTIAPFTAYSAFGTANGNDSGQGTISSMLTINSMKITGNAIINVNAPLTISTGGILIGNVGGVAQGFATTGGGSITSAGPDLVVILSSAAGTPFSIGVPIVGNIGYTQAVVSGALNTQLNASNSFTGDTNIDSGTVTLGNSNALSGSTLNYNSQGGTLSFGTLTSATLGGIKGNQSLALNSSMALTVGNGSNQSYSGVLSGSGASVTKTGSGTWTITSSPTYTGGTTVSNGTMTLTNGALLPSTGNISIGSGATLNVPSLSLSSSQILSGSGTLVGPLTAVSGSQISPGGGSIGTLSTGNVSLVSGTKVNEVFGSAGNSSLLSSSGALTLPSSGLILNIADNGGAGGLGSVGAGLYEIMSFNSETGFVAGTSGSSTFTVGTAPGSLAGRTYTFSLGSNQIDLQISAPNPPLTWTGLDGGNGATDSTWDTTARTNWANGSAPTAFASGAPVTFSDTNATTSGAITNYSVNVATGGVTPGSVTFTNNSPHAYTLTSADANGIAGSTGITMSGTGTVNLQGANSFSGPVAIQSGAINISNNASLGTSSGVTVSSGGVLQMSGNITVGSIPLSISGNGLSTAGALENVSGSNTYGGTVTLAANSTIGSDAGTLTLSAATSITGSGNNLTLAGSSGTGTISGAITTGSGTLTVSGGTWALNGTNTYTGGTTLTGGTTQINNAASLGATSGTAVINNATLEATASITTSRNFQLGNANSAIKVDSGKTYEIDGTINDGGSSGTLNATGSGTLIVTGANGYSGGTKISAGTVSVGNTGSLGGGPVTLQGSSPVLQLKPVGTSVTGSSATWNTVGGTASVSSGTLNFGFTGSDQVDAFWDTSKVAYSSFSTSFTFTAPTSGKIADGATFVLQNAGTNVHGGDNQSSRGYGYANTGAGQGPLVANSIAFVLGSANINGSTGAAGSAIGVGTGNASNATIPSMTNTTGGVNLSSGDPFQVTISGSSSSTSLNFTITDTLHPSQTETGTLSLGASTLGTILGGTSAFVGFTGSIAGGAAGPESISNFVYSLPFTGTFNPTNNVNVTTNSSIDLNYAGASSLGTLAIGSNTLAITNSSGGSANLTMGAVTLSGSPTFSPSASTNLALGSLNDSGTAQTITVSGAGSTGVVTLGSAASSLVNGTIVNVTSGTLASNNATALGSLAAVNVANGATFSAGASQTIGSLGDNGSVSVNGASVTLNGNTLTVGSTNNLSSTFSGVISNGSSAGGVTKAGTGALTLAGASTYTGPTAVNSGKLLVTGSLGNTAVSVGGNNASGTPILGGSGTIGGPVTIMGPGTGVAGHLAPSGGASTGSTHMTIANTLTFNVGAMLDYNLDSSTGGSNDLITISGNNNVTFNGTGTFNINAYNGSLALGNYVLISDPSGTISTPAGWSFTSNESGHSYSFFEPNSHTLDLTVSPPAAPIPMLAISTANGTRVISGQTQAISGTYGNTGAANMTNASLSDSGDVLTSSNFNPSGTFTVNAGSTGNPFTASVLATGSGTQGYGVTLSDTSGHTTGAAGSLDVITKRVITAGSSTSLGLFHNGAAVSVTSNAFTTSGTHDTTTDVQVAAGTGSADSNGVTLTGGPTSFTGSLGSDTRAFGGNISITNAVSGTVTGSFSLPVTTLENGGAGLTGEGSYASVPVAYSANVYSGNMIWNGASDSSYSTNGNWSDSVANGAQAAPGLDPNFATTDSATFGAVSSPTSVNLNGSSPSLNSITFNGNGNYTVAQGSGGSITMAGSSPSITAAGAQIISAPVVLAANTSITATGGSDSLTISGNISGGSGLSVAGSGTVVLSGTNSYLGNSTLNGGTTQINSASSLGAASSTAIINSATLEATTSILTPRNFQLGNSTSTIKVDSGATYEIDGTINNGGSAGTLNKTGTGTLVVTASNAYSGGTHINAGTVSVAAANSLGSGDVTLGGSSPILQLKPAGPTASTSSLTAINHSGAFTPTVSGNVVTLTSTNNDQSSSVWTGSTLGYANFTASFTYQAPPGGNITDGATFTLQNAGTTARGGESQSFPNGMGYGSNGVNTGPAVTPSVALVWQTGNVGARASAIGLGLNGTVGTLTNTTGGIDLSNGDPFQFIVTGSAGGTNLLFTVTDTLNMSETESGSLPLGGSLLSILGNSGAAYAGFTGSAAGGPIGPETITGFNYSSAFTGTFNPANNVVVSADSAIDLNYAGANALGNLTIGSNTLSITNSSTGSASLALENTNVSGTPIIAPAANVQLTLGALNDSSTASTVNLSGAGTSTVALNSGASSFVSGSSVHVNSGTLLLTNGSGSATGSGSIIVSSGASLGGNGTTNGPVTINSGGTIFTGLASSHTTAATLTVGPLSLGGSTLLNLTTVPVSPGLGGADEIVSGGLLTFGGTLNVADPNTLAYASGDTFDLFGFGSETGAFSNVPIGTSVSSASLPTLSGGLTWNTSALYSSGIISIGGGSGPANLFFTGSAGNGNWDIASTTNFTDGSSALPFHNGDNVTFDDTTGAGGHNTGQFTVTITSGGVVPGSMTVTGNTPYTFTGGNIGSGTSTSLTVASGAKMTVDRGAGSRITVELGSLSNSGTINLENNWLIVHNPNQTAADNTTAAIFTQLQNGFAGGTWAGGTSPSIISSGPNGAAGSSLYTLGEVESGTDVLVKYAYYGDADLTGHVDGTDYSLIDTGFGSAGALTGWQNGDFNYDGHIDGSDYSLIDNAFNTQLASAPAAQIAVNTSEIAGGSAAVPEPASLGLLGIGAIGLMSRRRRRV